jgi:hypothetical protein
VQAPILAQLLCDWRRRCAEASELAVSSELRVRHEGAQARSILLCSLGRGEKACALRAGIMGAERLIACDST